MPVNEVVVNGVTELSLVNDTVSEDTLLEGETAHDASGNQITGKVVVVPVDSELDAESENAIQNKAVAEALKNVDADTLDGLHATSFFKEIGHISSGSLKDYALALVGSGAVFVNKGVTDVPADSYWFVTINKCNTNHILIDATQIGEIKRYVMTYNAGTTTWSKWLLVNPMNEADKTKLDNTNTAYGTCATAAATAAKVVTITGNTNWKLAVGSEIIVKFTNTNTASNCTLNVNATGAKQIWYNNAVYTANSSVVCGYANRYVRYMYDGTYWVWMGWSVDSNTANTAGSTDTSSKIFLIGATSQAASPQTYSHDTCYVGTDGCLYSNGEKVLTASEGGATIYTGALPLTTVSVQTVTLGVKPKFVLCYGSTDTGGLRKWFAKSTSGGHANITLTSTGFTFTHVSNAYPTEYYIALA